MILKEAVIFVEQLYGRRNLRFNHDLTRLAGFLLVATRELQECVRKSDQDGLPRAFANVMAWNLAVVNYFRDSFAGEPFSVLMMGKYPASGCVYCGGKSCVCAAKRSRDMVSGLLFSDGQRGWNLRGWQRHLYEVYGQKNHEWGTDRVVNRLFSEVAELMELAVRATFMPVSDFDFERKLGRECCDILAWTLGLASIMGVDAENYFLQYYNKHCPECKKVPCTCGALVVERGSLVRSGKK